MGTDEQTMAWMMDTYSIHSGYTVTGVVTGKPVSVGGSEGRGGATSRGVMYAAFSALHEADIDHRGATVAVQGFGKAGSLRSSSTTPAASSWRCRTGRAACTTRAA